MFEYTTNILKEQIHTIDALLNSKLSKIDYYNSKIKGYQEELLRAGRQVEDLESKQRELKLAICLLNPIEQ